MHNLYNDALLANTVFRRGNNSVQIFVTNFGWLSLIPLRLISEAHEALSLLFQWDGVPPAIICEHAKEMIQGEFNRKLKKASCQFQQTEPLISWSIAAEKEIKEQGSEREISKSKAPKRLWGDFFVFKSYI